MVYPVLSNIYYEDFPFFMTLTSTDHLCIGPLIDYLFYSMDIYAYVYANTLLS